jgi:hypothetical protein
MGGDRLDEQGPPLVPPRPLAGEQRLDVVQHDQRPVLHERLGQLGEVVAQGGGVVDQVSQLQAGQLPFEREREIGQRGSDVVAFGRGGVPGHRGEGGLVGVGQLHCAGGLAGPGHPVEDHPCMAAAWGQRGGGAGHRPDPADELVRLGRELGQLLPLGLEHHRLARRRGQPQISGAGAEQRRGGRRQRRCRAGRRVGRGLGQGQRQRSGDRLAFAQQQVVERAGQCDREVVDHRVAHRQHRAVQAARHLRCHRRQHSGGGNVGAGGWLQAEQVQVLGGGDRSGLAG